MRIEKNHLIITFIRKNDLRQEQKSMQ